LGGGDKEPARERTVVVVAGERFADFARQGTLGAIGNEFDGVDEVLLLGPELGKAFGLGQVLESEFSGCLAAFFFQLFERELVSFKTPDPLLLVDRQEEELR